MDDVAQRFAARDRLRRRLAAQATPEQRVADMMRLQQITWDILRSSPAGYAHFIARNYKARAIPVRDDDATRL